MSSIARLSCLSLVAATRLAAHDNSAANPHNLDPARAVHVGLLRDEEMMSGCSDAVRDADDGKR
jgi:hypothetical protein